MDFLIPLICCFFISVFVIKITKPIAVKAGLVDLPNERKLHIGAIPLIGGVAIYLGVLTAALIFMPYSQVFNIYLVSAAMILFLGVLDDKYDLSVKLRIISQIIVASMMIFGAQLYLNSFGYILGFFEFKLGYIGILVTIVAVIGAINAFNMVDGIDGLAGMLSLISFSSLAFLLSRVNNDWFHLSVLFIAALLAYLMFNLRWPFKSVTKIFMGDAGSMLIGLTIVWLLVIGTNNQVNAFRPVTALYIIAIPLMDMTAIMYRRIKKGVSPFSADREHLHHIFERAGLTRKKALITISFMALMIATFGCLGEVFQIYEWLMFSIFIVMFICYSWAISHVWQILSWFRKTK